jgi:hypothetical protein
MRKINLKTILTPEAVEVSLKLKVEIENFSPDFLKNEKFIQAVFDDLAAINFESKEADSLHLDRLVDVGQVAVRTYQSFDSVPGTDKFVELACQLSAVLKADLSD